MLIKFCKPCYNLASGCRSIRLGTLAYYRSLDPSFPIADSSEGIERTVIRSISTDSCTPDAAQAIASFINMPHVHVQGIKLSATFPNSYIWCCSQVAGHPTSKMGVRFDSEYSSSFIITDPDRFCKCINNLLLRNATLACFSERGHGHSPKLSVHDLRLISVTCLHRPVVYADKKENDIQGGVLDAYEKEIPAPFRQVFVKPRKYQDDREYRFLFLFTHPQLGQLPVRDDPIDLPIPSILNISEVIESSTSDTP